jgi:hypothetical protein
VSEWLTMVTIALALWGRSVVSSVEVHLDSPPPLDPGVMATADWFDGPGGRKCVLSIVSDRIPGLTAEWRQDLVTHELGHCVLGTGAHLAYGQGVMSPALGTHFSLADRLWYWRVYGQPHLIGGISVAAQ